MIAYEKWKLVKEEMEHAVEEGKFKGYDKEEKTFKNGCFFAYDYVLKLMNSYDDDGMEEHYHD
jgi:hypothetical protein